MMSFQPPLTLMAFFRKSAGTWFTQRTVHHFDVLADESGESNLIVTLIEKDDPRIIATCQQQGIELSAVAGGASFAWQDNLDTEPPNADYAAILIDVPDTDGRSGKILRDKGYVEKIPVVSHYWFGQDGILTINTDYDNNQGQERCWFITDDFRVRVSTVRLMNGISLMTYCSERRCVELDELEAMCKKHQQPT
jgi:hypothetical protein